MASVVGVLVGALAELAVRLPLASMGFNWAAYRCAGRPALRAHCSLTSFSRKPPGWTWCLTCLPAAGLTTPVLLCRDRVGHMHETPRNVVADFFGRAKVNDTLGNLDLPGLKHVNPADEADAAQPRTAADPKLAGSP